MRPPLLYGMSFYVSVIRHRLDRVVLHFGSRSVAQDGSLSLTRSN
ncbi:hypothetical protein BZL30_2531 [Mycobacterium kansasii]|uniref:Uncharacterized protein n=1 Tax=Mycobacterium kansasii TaxID=1768 RepID=A0A1V3XIP9_MYCKA|nr:hypothetical protein BZL30_2531 [Mycobacterium kansasii]